MPDAVHISDVNVNTPWHRTHRGTTASDIGCVETGQLHAAHGRKANVGRMEERQTCLKTDA